MIVVDVKKEMGNRKSDLTHMAYYMEKDVCWSYMYELCLFAFFLKSCPLTDLVIFILQVKVLPLFKNQDKFEPTIGNQKLEMESILVYYVDEEAPTITMKHLSGGIIAVIVVVVLAVVAGLLVLVSASMCHFFWHYDVDYSACES